MLHRLVRRSLALAGAAILISTTAVSADDISNNIDTTIDIPAEVMALNVGGPAGTTNLYVQPRNDDGKNGCNLTGSTVPRIERRLRQPFDRNCQSNVGDVYELRIHSDSDSDTTEPGLNRRSA